MKEIGTPPKINMGDEFDIYVHVLATGQHNEKRLDKGRFIGLGGLEGIFKIQGIYELGHSAQHRLELIRENPPKDYRERIDKIDNYSTSYQEDSFKLMT